MAVKPKPEPPKPKLKPNSKEWFPHCFCDAHDFPHHHPDNKIRRKEVAS